MAINNAQAVREQYKTAGPLNTRIAIHQKYSTNKTGFGNWIVSHYDIKPGFQLLELGCGTGDMWKDHLNRLEGGAQLYLTDFSQGMLSACQDTLGARENLHYEIVNIEQIPHADESFDRVIANMMLYHVPDIHQGLSEVRRVLKKDGAFYCATYGENGIIEYVAALLAEYGVKDPTNKTFTLQNGKALLEKHFSQVQRLDYADALDVTDLEDLLDYVYSFTSLSNLADASRDALRRILEEKMVNGVLHVPKEYGMFVCRP